LLVACAIAVLAKSVQPSMSASANATPFKDRMARSGERDETVMAGVNLAWSRVGPYERTEVRRQLLAARNALTTLERVAADAALIDHLDPTVRAGLERRSDPTKQPTIPQSAPVIGVYWPVRGEPDLSDWYRRVRGRGWHLALPRADAGEPLVFGLWGPAQTLVAGPWQIALPDPFLAVEPDLLIVPCVGFDAHGWRLGYGGGFYDRTLAIRRIPAIGVARSGGQVGELVPQTHDIALDAIVTEHGAHPAHSPHSPHMPYTPHTPADQSEG
jgi:5,10-methenyltetrahydrofolate synthetase